MRKMGWKRWSRPRRPKFSKKILLAKNETQMPRASYLLDDTQMIEDENSLTGDKKLARYYDLYEKRAHSLMERSRAEVARAALRGKEKVE